MSWSNSQLIEYDRVAASSQINGGIPHNICRCISCQAKKKFNNSPNFPHIGLQNNSSSTAVYTLDCDL